MDRLLILKNLKKELLKKGFIIKGIVGSFSRGEKYKDIDYSIDKGFLKTFRGFRAMIEIEEIKNYLKEKLGIEVDLIPKNIMSKTAKKYTLKDLILIDNGKWRMENA